MSSSEGADGFGVVGAGAAARGTDFSLGVFSVAALSVAAGRWGSAGRSVPAVIMGSTRATNVSGTSQVLPFTRTGASSGTGVPSTRARVQVRGTVPTRSQVGV